MKYFVRIGEDEHEVELDGDRIVAGDETLHGYVTEIEGTPVRMVTLGNEVHRVVVRRGQRRGELTLWIGGHRFQLDALDARARTIRALSKHASTASGPAPLVAPMPGLIIRVLAAAGDQVSAGQGLIVMEAMKMENELRASSAGIVKQVHVEPGTAVEKGTLLLEME
jgi:biotin carboxyl carrier protein